MLCGDLLFGNGASVWGPPYAGVEASLCSSRPPVLDQERGADRP